jgi:hypothetical protein
MGADVFAWRAGAAVENREKWHLSEAVRERNHGLPLTGISGGSQWAQQPRGDTMARHVFFSFHYQRDIVRVKPNQKSS